MEETARTPPPAATEEGPYESDWDDFESGYPFSTYDATDEVPTWPGVSDDSVARPTFSG